jgi:hypothetical protein
MGFRVKNSPFLRFLMVVFSIVHSPIFIRVGTLSVSPDGVSLAHFSAFVKSCHKKFEILFAVRVGRGGFFNHIKGVK